jgi:hypothetical protein
VRRERKPGLREQCDDSSPIEDEAGGEVHFHIMPSNMEHNEGKCVQERKNEERVWEHKVSIFLRQSVHMLTYMISSDEIPATSHVKCR